MGIDADYEQYLKDSLRYLISSETLVREAVKVFKASLASNDPLAIRKVHGSLLVSSFSSFTLVRECFIKNGITEKEILDAYGLIKPKKNWKNKTCAPLYVTYFKGLLDEIEKMPFVMNGKRYGAELTPEKIVYNILTYGATPSPMFPDDNQIALTEKLVEVKTSIEENLNTQDENTSYNKPLENNDLCADFPVKKLSFTIRKTHD